MLCKIDYVNALSCSFHFDEFAFIFESTPFDTILIGEKWLKSYIPSKSVERIDYHIFQNNRFHKVGGSVGAFHERLHFKTTILQCSDPLHS